MQKNKQTKKNKQDNIYAYYALLYVIIKIMRAPVWVTGKVGERQAKAIDK